MKNEDRGTGFYQQVKLAKMLNFQFIKREKSFRSTSDKTQENKEKQLLKSRADRNRWRASQLFNYERKQLQTEEAQGRPVQPCQKNTKHRLRP